MAAAAATACVPVFALIQQQQQQSERFLQQNQQSCDSLGLQPLDEAVGRRADYATYASLLKQCGNAKALSEGKKVHAHIVACGHDGDTYLGNLVVHMYGRCGDVQDAHRAFRRVQQPNVFSWNMLIGAYAHNGYGRQALAIFRQMAVEGVEPNLVTFINTVSACSALGKLAEGKAIHARIDAAGYDSHRVIGTALVNMYGKCGSLEDARSFFHKIPEKNVFSWNAMIATCVQNKRSEEALKLYREMESTRLQLDHVTYISVLTACVSLGDLAEGRRVHEKIISSGLEHYVDVANCLVNMYGKCGSLGEARAMFDRMTSRNLGSWNAIIAAYAQNGEGNKAFELYREMDLKGIKLDQITFASVVSACSSMGGLAEGKLVHANILAHGFESDVVVGTALVNMYSKCGSLSDARSVFDRIGRKDIICWTAMITAYAQAGQGRQALELYRRMDCRGAKPSKITLTSVLAACSTVGALEDGKAIHAEIMACDLDLDIAVGNALVNMYGKCDNSLEHARNVFDNMLEKDIITWNTMIGLYARTGNGRTALELYNRMEAQGVKPDEGTFVTVFQACSEIGALAEGRAAHAHLVATKLKLKMHLVGTALFNMYSKCGSLDEARGVFKDLCIRDVVSWTGMIAAYAQHGQAQESLVVFREMYLDGIVPNRVTFVSVLHACNHAGLLDDGLQCFVGMIQDHSLEPTNEQYGCMVDLVARAGWLAAAEELIWSMPFQPDAVVWTSLLGACRTHLDVERGERAAEFVFELDPGNATPYLILGNIYTATGRWDELEKLCEMMKLRGVTKPAGMSFVTA